MITALERRHVIARYGRYLAMTGDPEKALRLLEKYFPRDMKHEAMLRKIVKAAQ